MQMQATMDTGNIGDLGFAIGSIGEKTGKHNKKRFEKREFDAFD